MGHPQNPSECQPDQTPDWKKKQQEQQDEERRRRQQGGHEGPGRQGGQTYQPGQR